MEKFNGRIEGLGGCGLNRVKPSRLRETIDDCLAWAYRDELPKLGAQADASIGGPQLAGMASIWRWIEGTGVRVDATNAFGCVPLTGYDFGEPDADAVALASLVQATAGAVFAPIEGGDLLDDVACEILQPHERVWFHAEGFRRALTIEGTACGNLPAAIASAAHLGSLRAPSPVEALERKLLVRNGKPLWFRMVGGQECDGFNRRTQRPFPGAYRKDALTLDMIAVVAERIEYQAHRAALDWLAEAYGVGPSRAPWRPWRMDRDAGPALRLLTCETQNAQAA